MLYNTDYLNDDKIKLILHGIVKGDNATNLASGYHFIIFDDKANKIGFCSLDAAHYDKQEKKGNIYIMINKIYTNRGYAKRAFAILIEFATNLQLGYIIIACNSDNQAIKKNCENSGCVLMEMIDAVDNTSCGICTFKKEL